MKQTDNQVPLSTTSPLPSFVNPAMPGQDDVPIVPWNLLQFNMNHMYHLRRHLGVLPIYEGLYTSKRANFDASDLAWFAEGMHHDGQHRHSDNEFHPIYMNLHQESLLGPSGKFDRKTLLQRLQNLTFDLATLWDRASGGTTLIVHANPTMVPGTPPRPEFMKANVYLPPAFLEHNPHLHTTISHIVQLFLETVGVRTVVQWTRRARRNLHYSLNQTRIVNPNPKAVGIPNPEPDTSHYVFLGQPASNPPSSPAPASSLSSDQLEARVADLAVQLLHAEETVAVLSAEKAAVQDELEAGKQQITALETELRLHTHPNDITQHDTFPPAYATSPATPPRHRTNHAGTPHPGPSRTPAAAPSTPYSPRTPAQQSVRLYIAYLRNEGLEHLTGGVSLAIRATEHAAWIEEFEKIGVPSTIAAKLVTVVGLDG
ncbi:hypothetical protein GALMADRAFT_229951 [Galerina marginata CBS 339.88]|uniref:Uncharacterized protein n=1 Tax=Galerina marginata (strain CBS 339.88) TaxID=685588 RepID=A0A067SUW8_GALM3|nr:hypothetical protein GALMADRAFT_229951 [Galerina marginata CBS 339.88]